MPVLHFDLFSSRPIEKPANCKKKKTQQMGGQIQSVLFLFWFVEKILALKAFLVAKNENSKMLKPIVHFFKILSSFGPFLTNSYCRGNSTSLAFIAFFAGSIVMVASLVVVVVLSIMMAIQKRILKRKEEHRTRHFLPPPNFDYVRMLMSDQKKAKKLL